MTVADYFHNIEYLTYVRKHHPEAIDFLRSKCHIFKEIDPVWIDIRKFDTYSAKSPDGAWLPGTRDIILFHHIIFDIFPRKIHPKYTKDPDYNRYLTWATATEDIANQRSKGYSGEHFICKCELNIEKSADKTKTVFVEGYHTSKTIENPLYKEYLESPAYKKYQKDLADYEEKYAAFTAYRTSYHEFVLGDGTVKNVLLYVKPDEKLLMLEKLGVDKNAIEDARRRMVKPIKPVEPPKPDQYTFIDAYIPGYYKEKIIPGKYVWRHYVKSVNRYNGG